MLEEIREEKDPRSLLVGLQTAVAKTEISAEKPQKAKKRSPTGPAQLYHAWHVVKGLNIPLHRHLLTIIAVSTIAKMGTT